MSENKGIKLSNKWLSLIAYIGIGCIAVSLLLTLILANNSSLSNAFKSIGECIAYIISIIVAYNWVANHKQLGWIICYVVFVVTIIVLFILNVV